MSLHPLFFPAFRLALPALFCLALLIPAAAQARPEMAAQNAEARFAAMDADKDGIVSREEFCRTYPQMKDAAFDAIDTNKDGAISLEEWNAFAAGHGKDGDPHGEGKAPHGMGGGMPPKGADNGKAPELIMPPREGN